MAKRRSAPVTYDPSSPWIAWAAGIFDGEGWLGLDGTKVRLEVEITDLDLLERFATIAGLGTIVSRKHKPGTKPTWRYQLSGAGALDLMLAFAPYLGSRRLGRLKEIIEATAPERLPELALAA